MGETVSDRLQNIEDEPILQQMMIQLIIAWWNWNEYHLKVDRATKPTVVLIFSFATHPERLKMECKEYIVQAAPQWKI